MNTEYIHSQIPSRLSCLHHGAAGFCNATGPRVATPHFRRIEAAIITVQVAFRKDGNVWDVAVQGSSLFCYGRRHLLCKIFGLPCNSQDGEQLTILNQCTTKHSYCRTRMEHTPSSDNTSYRQGCSSEHTTQLIRPPPPF